MMKGNVAKPFFARERWRDAYVYGVVRKEWKGPKILAKTAFYPLMQTSKE
jgi:hypothetical protein